MIQRAFHTQYLRMGKMNVFCCGIDVCVPKKLLNHEEWGFLIQQVSCKSMANEWKLFCDTVTFHGFMENDLGCAHMERFCRINSRKKPFLGSIFPVIVAKEKKSYFQKDTIPILEPFPLADMYPHIGAVDVRYFQVYSFTYPESR